MKLKPQQLSSALKKGLAPLYLVVGDEPLQQDEVSGAIRRAAQEAGFSEREVLTVDSRFQWESLRQVAKSPSLFADKRIIELRMGDTKPGDRGSKALIAYCDDCSEDNLLLIRCGKVEAAQKRGKWYQTLEQTGVVVEVWPITQAELPRWLQQRAAESGYTLNQNGALLLAERVEGNLLAAVQELEKLYLLHPQERTLAEDDVAAAVANHSRYSIYALAEAALAGDPQRVCRIMSRLELEGAAQPLLLWTLSRDFRLLQALTAPNADSNEIFTRERIFYKMQPLYLGARSRLQRIGWQRLLARCGRIDRIVKGEETGNSWDELLQLALLMTGTRLL
ncbi:MAG: DNA polymerase III subunit delta [Gammaproteobacteria bacterium]|nr:DNA polymerase III subunit delta [Gammaproteobacteria bacterium]